VAKEESTHFIAIVISSSSLSVSVDNVQSQEAWITSSAMHLLSESVELPLVITILTQHLVIMLSS
jgi:NADH:ubiquinone oxidoreductase subunit E